MLKKKKEILPITDFPSVLNELDICFSLYLGMGSMGIIPQSSTYAGANV